MTCCMYLTRAAGPQMDPFFCTVHAWSMWIGLYDCAGDTLNNKPTLDASQKVSFMLTQALGMLNSVQMSACLHASTGKRLR